MFWVVAYCSEYAPSARLSLRLRVLRTRSLGATGDRCLVTVTPEHPTSPVLLPEVRERSISLEPARLATAQVGDHPRFALNPMGQSGFLGITEAFLEGNASEEDQ